MGIGDWGFRLNSKISNCYLCQYKSFINFHKYKNFYIFNLKLNFHLLLDMFKLVGTNISLNMVN